MIKVLIIEDEPQVAEMNKNYLAKIPGFALRGIASNCTAALALLRSEPIDLVLVDIFLPGMDGLQMLAKLRQEGHGADVIMLTAARDMESIKRALQFGAVDYLIKPVAFERFAEALKQYAARVETMNAPTLTQRQLDEQLIGRTISDCLPKGLEKQTLKVIEQAIASFTMDFTIEQLVQVTGISRVTLRKYTDYLADKGDISAKQVYGSIGRPVTKYRKIH